MNTEASRVNPLGTEKVGALLRKYAIPSIISLIINSLYNIVDQIFIGHGVGYLGNGATNIVAPIATIAIALSALFGDGLAAIYSFEFRAQRAEESGPVRWQYGRSGWHRRHPVWRIRLYLD